jgi:hypothetical protein
MVVSTRCRQAFKPTPNSLCRRVEMPQGKPYWYTALATTDSQERLPITAPPEERYKALKEALQMDGPSTPSMVATGVDFSSENLTVSSRWVKCHIPCHCLSPRITGLGGISYSTYSYVRRGDP